jgi:hypothetical protein
MTVSLQRVRVALRLPTNASDLLILAKAIVEKTTGNPWFPAPVPSLATAQAAIDQLEVAEIAARSGTLGLKTARNAARAKLVKLLSRLKAYVQGVAEDNPDFAHSIVESAAMNVATRGTRVIAILAARAGSKSGEVRLVAKAVAKVATYEWQLRKDRTKTWVGLGKTVQAKTTAKGLVAGTTYWFRFRAVTRRGVGEWCDAVAYVVQ